MLRIIILQWWMLFVTLQSGYLLLNESFDIFAISWKLKHFVWEMN